MSWSGVSRAWMPEEGKAREQGMRDVSPRDTAHVINSHTNSFVCAFHSAMLGGHSQTLQDRSLNPALSSPLGVSPSGSFFPEQQPSFGPGLGEDGNTT